MAHMMPVIAAFVWTPATGRLRRRLDLGQVYVMNHTLPSSRIYPPAPAAAYQARDHSVHACDDHALITATSGWTPMTFVTRETFNAVSVVTRGGVFIRKRSPQPGSENPARRSALAPSNAVVPLRALEDISALFALEHISVPGLSRAAQACVPRGCRSHFWLLRATGMTAASNDCCFSAARGQTSRKITAAES